MGILLLVSALSFVAVCAGDLAYDLLKNVLGSKAASICSILTTMSILSAMAAIPIVKILKD